MSRLSYYTNNPLTVKLFSFLKAIRVTSQILFYTISKLWFSVNKCTYANCEERRHQCLWSESPVRTTMIGQGKKKKKKKSYFDRFNLNVNLEILIWTQWKKSMCKYLQQSGKKNNKINSRTHTHVIHPSNSNIFKHVCVEGNTINKKKWHRRFWTV